MSGEILFLTHAEVEIDPAVPVPDWGLNARGRERHAAFAGDPMLDGVVAVFSSTERKAIEGATSVAERLGLTVNQRAALGENNRSATGYLPPDEFWPVVDRFFADPETSVRGWERACDAQARIVEAVRAVLDEASAGKVLIVSHGGVGTLLRCHLAGRAITRAEGQPNSGGGCWFAFSRDLTTAPTDWSSI